MRDWSLCGGNLGEKSKSKKVRARGFAEIQLILQLELSFEVIIFCLSFCAPRSINCKVFGDTYEVHLKFGARAGVATPDLGC